MGANIVNKTILAVMLMLSSIIAGDVYADTTDIEAPSPIADVNPITPASVTTDTSRHSTVSSQKQNTDTTSKKSEDSTAAKNK